MNDMHNKQLLEAQEEATLKHLMKEHMDAEGEALSETLQSDGGADMPGDLDERCRALIGAAGSEAAEHHRHKQAGGVLKRAAIFTLVLLCLGSTLVVSVDALRLPVLNYLFDRNERASLVSTNTLQPADNASVELVDQILCVPLPDDFYLVEQEEGNSRIWLQFENSQHAEISVTLISSTGQMSIDTENAEQEIVRIYNYDAIYIQKEGFRVMWLDPNREVVIDVHATGISENVFWEYIYRLAE